jgi:hypothetical protein
MAAAAIGHAKPQEDEMKKLRQHLIAAVLLALLAAIGMIMNSRQAAAQDPHPGSAPVTVQNTAANPVPVGIIGTTTVNLAPGATVKLALGAILALARTPVSDGTSL